jgi:uncharacterized membrane protein YqaE (UPF0057 family)
MANPTEHDERDTRLIVFSLFLVPLAIHLSTGFALWFGYGVNHNMTLVTVMISWIQASCSLDRLAGIHFP